MITPDSSILEAARLMTAKSVSSLVVVVVEKNVPIAMITEGDIIKGIISKETKIKDIMDKNFTVISPNTSFYEVNKMLREKNIKRFLVVEDGKLIGLITETDIVESIRDITRFHQILQEVILAVFGLATAFFLFYFSPFGASVFQ